MLVKFVEELEEVTRGKPFRAWNDIVWMMLLDTRDMLVVHTASFAKGLYSPGGLLPQIQAHHLRELPRDRRWRASDEGKDEPLDRLLDGGHVEAYERLFPGAGATPKPVDVEGLIGRFKATVQPVIDDRHANRAHLYERGKRATAKMLDMTEVGGILDGIAAVLNDLTHVAKGSTWTQTDMNAVSSGAVAEDLVDDLLIGMHRWHGRALRGRRRDEYYAELHARHDADGEGLFNDERVVDEDDDDDG